MIFESHEEIWSWIPLTALDDTEPKEFNKEMLEKIKSRDDQSKVFISFETHKLLTFPA